MQKTIFTQEIIAKDHYFDELDHINNVIYVKWIQDLAEAHWKNMISIKDSTDHLWVAVRHEIDYKKEIRRGAKIIGKTWVESMEGVRSVRHCEIHAQEEGRQAELRAKSKTIWCMIDADTKRPKRIPEEMKTIFM